jgi:hypothetical protein
MQLNQKH